jgi:hypothetical protein
MVSPNLTVLEDPQADVHLSARARALLEAAAAILQLDRDVVLELLLTHGLAALQRLQPLDLILPFGEPNDHKRGSDDV